MATGRITAVRSVAGTLSASGSGDGGGTATVASQATLTASGYGFGTGTADATFNAFLGVQPVSPSLFQSAIVSGNTPIFKVEIHDLAKTPTLIGTVRPKTGAVTADFVTGQRRTLSVTFDPSLESLLYPGVELRPFSGFDYGSGAVDLLPLGQFPLTATDISISPADDIQVSPADKWQWIVGTTLLTPWSTTPGKTIKSLLTQLVLDSGMWTAGQITNTITSNAKATSQVWDQDRQQAISDLCKTVGAEAFVSRTGVFILRDRKAKGAPVVTMRGGNGGRLIKATVSTDTGSVYNAVTIIPANTDPAFYVPPITVRIVDPNHPAYARPGKVMARPYRLDGAQFTSTIQATAAAQKILTRISGKAEQVSLQCMPDMSLDESDTISVVLPSGKVKVGQIQQITYPLNTTDEQQITTVSTRSDEDFQP